jgi:BirA family biotin operon repressor/biotin-[acetyl-CoA-carboxylase] ligase
MFKSGYNSPVIFLETASSTGDVVRQLAGEGKLAGEGAVMAGFQTAGRGQAGAFWESEAGKNLTCSILYYPRLPARRAFVIAEMAALSVKGILDRHVRHIAVKWPNDVYWKDRKICGILIENDFRDGRVIRSIVGFGLNLNQTLFFSNAPNPVSLSQITGMQYRPEEMLEQLRSEFHRYVQQLETEGTKRIHATYERVLYRRDGFHLWKDETGRFEARLREIEPTGRLILERRDGTISLYAFKEIEFVTRLNADH